MPISATATGCGVAIVGGGPAGLAAAEQALAAGCTVHLFDAMPSVGRKFLLAGRGGLNLTHSEPADRFVARYREAAGRVGGWLNDFSPQDLRDWAQELGIETFIGTSGRVFPREFKAAPLLRAWLSRLRAQGLMVHVRHRWTGGLPPDDLRFATPSGEVQVQAAAVVLALGGASWPTLGSDGAWQAALAACTLPQRPLVPANCGFEADWSAHLRSFAGTPFKNIALHFGNEMIRGELILTETGLEGGAVYALSAPLREALAADGSAEVRLDLKPDLSGLAVEAKLSEPRGAASRSTWLKKTLRLSPAALALLHEPGPMPDNPSELAARIKGVPLRLLRPRPIAEAISSAGGLGFEGLTHDLMIRDLPGVFAAGEMLDWEAPTGGYLLQACFASGRRAGAAAARFVMK